MNMRWVPSVSLFVSLGILSFPAHSQAVTIANCSGMNGFSNYHHTELVPRKDSGFQEDKISGGATTLQRLANDEYDVLIVDARRRAISMRNDGGKILLLRNGANDATFLVIFPGMVVELYTFYREKDGTAKVDLLSSKGGDDMPIHKSSVMSGACQHLDLSLVK